LLLLSFTLPTAATPRLRSCRSRWSTTATGQLRS